MKKIIIYDFDGTLTPNPFPKYKFLDNIDIMNIAKDQLSTGKNIYQLFYEVYFNEFKKLNIALTDEVICDGSKDIELCEDLDKFLKNLNDQGDSNYIITSGLKVYLENILIAKYFDEIYGTTLKYDGNEIIGVEYLMTDKDKVKTIKKIMEDHKLDNCHSIIYIGDGLTDMDSFKFVYENGGTSIFVYGEKKDIIKRPYISYYLKRDYRLKSELYDTVINKID